MAKFGAKYMILVLWLCLGVHVYGISLQAHDDGDDGDDDDDVWTGPSISITQSWSQETNYVREVPYKVYGTGGPIIIALGGGNTQGTYWEDIVDDKMLPNMGNFVLFMPSGYETEDDDGELVKSWNSINEPSRAPDVEFVEEIAEKAATLCEECNSSKGVALIGTSSGCVFMLRFLIESQSSDFERFFCMSGELTTIQYRDGVFYAKEEPETYQEFSESQYSVADPQPLATGRTLWLIHGTEDQTIPAEGGPNDALPGNTEYLGFNETALAIAQRYGCGDESEIVAIEQGGDIPGYKYTSCAESPHAVAWWSIEGAPHGMVKEEKGYWNGPNASVCMLAAKLLSTCDGCDSPAQPKMDTSVDLKRLRSKKGLRLLRGRSHKAL